MDLAARSRQHASPNHRKTGRSGSSPEASQLAIEEINAYIAVRDGLMAEAISDRSEAAIESLALANNFVSNCLGPARQPYLTQCLPAKDAARELQRCHAADAQIARFRARRAA